MSPSWHLAFLKTGEWILNADILLWQQKYIYSVPSVLAYLFGIHIFTTHTKRALILVIELKNLLFASKLPAGMHASKILKDIKNVWDNNCDQVTHTSES
jgi:hypothetical protein